MLRRGCSYRSMGELKSGQSTLDVAYCQIKIVHLKLCMHLTIASQITIAPTFLQSFFVGVVLKRQLC